MIRIRRELRGFFATVRNADFSKLSGAVKPRQLFGVSKVRFDPVGRPKRRQTRSDHGAFEAQRRDLALKIIAAWACLIDEVGRTCGGHPLYEPV